MQGALNGSQTRIDTLIRGGKCTYFADEAVDSVLTLLLLNAAGIQQRSQAALCDGWFGPDQ
jgi:hypothetical protein